MDESKVIKIDKLDGCNYKNWCYQIKLILIEHDLWSTVEPGEDKPTDERSLKEYNARHNKALAKICLAINRQQQQHIMQFETPKEVWKALEELYAPKDNRYRIIQLRRKLYTEKF